MRLGLGNRHTLPGAYTTSMMDKSLCRFWQNDSLAEWKAQHIILHPKTKYSLHTDELDTLQASAVHICWSAYIIRVQLSDSIGHSRSSVDPPAHCEWRLSHCGKPIFLWGKNLQCVGSKTAALPTEVLVMGSVDHQKTPAPINSVIYNTNPVQWWGPNKD